MFYAKLLTKSKKKVVIFQISARYSKKCSNFGAVFNAKSSNVTIAAHNDFGVWNCVFMHKMKIEEKWEKNKKYQDKSILEK